MRALNLLGIPYLPLRAFSPEAGRMRLYEAEWIEDVWAERAKVDAAAQAKKQLEEATAAINANYSNAKAMTPEKYAEMVKANPNDRYIPYADYKALWDEFSEYSPNNANAKTVDQAMGAFGMSGFVNTSAKSMGYGEGLKQFKNVSNLYQMGYSDPGMVTTSWGGGDAGFSSDATWNPGGHSLTRDLSDLGHPGYSASIDPYTGKIKGTFKTSGEGGGFFGGLIKDLGPMALMALSFGGGGLLTQIGGAIAPSASAATQKLIGNAVMSTALSGGDVGKALTNALVSAGISAVSASAGSTVTKALSDAGVPKGVADAVTNGATTAAKTLATGGDLSTAVTRGLVGGASSAVDSAVTDATGGSNVAGNVAGLAAQVALGVKPSMGGLINAVGSGAQADANAIYDGSDAAKTSGSSINTVGTDTSGTDDTVNEAAGLLNSKSSGGNSVDENTNFLDFLDGAVGFDEASNDGTTEGIQEEIDKINSTDAGWVKNSDGSETRTLDDGSTITRNADGTTKTTDSTGGSAGDFSWSPSFTKWLKSTTGIDIGGVVGGVSSWVKDNPGLAQIIAGGIGAMYKAQADIDTQKLKNQGLLDQQNNAQAIKLANDAKFSSSVSGIRKPAGLLGLQQGPLAPQQRLTRSDGSNVFGGGGLLNRA